MKLDGFSDLDELILACNSAHTKKIIKEAVACYNAKAYKASITTSWMAVVYDVIEKCREMSFAGHKAAKKVIKEFEERQLKLENSADRSTIQASLNFERDVLNLAKDKLEIIDTTQFIELERVREDRNRCAHPSYQKIDIPYNPTAELARAHIKSVVLHLLSEPPVQGKFALDRIMNGISSVFFPTDPKKIETALRTSGYVKPSDALLKSLCYEIFDEYLNADWNKKRKYIKVLQFLLQDEHSIVHKKLSDLVNSSFVNFADDDLKSLFHLCIGHSDFSALMNTNSINKVSKFIRKANLSEEKFLIEKSLSIPELKSSSEFSIKTSDQNNLAYFIDWIIMFSSENSICLPEIVIKRIVELLGQCKSWDEVNATLDKILFPFQKPIMTTTLVDIFTQSLQSEGDIIGSFGLETYVKILNSRDDLDRKGLSLKIQELGHVNLAKSFEVESEANDKIPF